jgi:hypothetical protein
MAKVDLTKYLTYIRKQGGPGCWGYATLAIWDVMNETRSANPPNLSMNLWLMQHARRDLWEKKIPAWVVKGKFRTPDGQYHPINSPGPEWGFFQSFGITTEGTEPHIAGTRFSGQITRDGTNEAGNYRLASEPKSITISTTEFKKQLDKWYPIRLEAGPHVVAILGYDDAKKTFTFVDSAGDQAHGGDGFGTFTYAEINAKKSNWLGTIHKAYTIEVVPPRPVPVAEIWVKHSATRLNVNLWLSVEGSIQQKRKIWPPYEIDSYDTGRPFDDSRTLHYRVPLPTETIWPPATKRRVLLDLYDSNAIERGAGGGEMIAFRAAFGNHIINSKQVIKSAPIQFKAYQHRRFAIP